MATLTVNTVPRLGSATTTRSSQQPAEAMRSHPAQTRSQGQQRRRRADHRHLRDPGTVGGLGVADGGGSVTNAQSRLFGPFPAEPLRRPDDGPCDHHLLGRDDGHRRRLQDSEGMMEKTYEIGPGGVDWATSRLGQPAEEGESYEIELTQAEEKSLVAAGWLVESEKKEKK